MAVFSLVPATRNHKSEARTDTRHLILVSRKTLRSEFKVGRIFSIESYARDIIFVFVIQLKKFVSTLLKCE